MQKKFVALVVVFGVLLLLPFSMQAVVDLRSDKRFLSLDIFKDAVYTPFKREAAIAAAVATLDSSWRAARESMAAGGDVVESTEGTVSALSDLESVVLAVNTYAELDSSEPDYKALMNADTLLAALEDEPESFPAVDSCIKALTAEFGSFSLARAFLGVKRYGIWTSRYLRAFEHKVEDENALVLAVRPRYQLAVWNIFNDPGEKVVLGKNPGPRTSNLETQTSPWLYYRQDVEFLVQPSPLDVRSAKLDNPIQGIAKFRDQLKAKNVELLVVVVPGKPSIYPERLTGGEASATPVFGHGKRILDSLTALGFHTVNLYDPLWAAKAEDAKLGALYLNDDTHWTPRGAELAAEVIAGKVMKMQADSAVSLSLKSKYANPAIEYMVADSVADRMGDIGEMSGLNKFNVFKVQQVTGHVVSQRSILERIDMAQSSADCFDSVCAKYNVTGDSCNRFGWKMGCEEDDTLFYDTTYSVFKDDFKKSEILILGDSFSRIYQTDAPVNAGWIAHLAKNLDLPVSSIVSDGGASTLVREKLARKANVLKGKKLLIWEFVERDLRFGAEGWKNVDF
ncbi:alginate O-acetyltransferase AlgX-related protein [Fibrobacter sp.]|uniref:alginate O-acetyltransferase AlgX-related protein n=1 Tax=Fibrobacter sp. TaxID=35828 RepID=UPI00388D4117